MQTIIEILKKLSLHHTAVWLALTYIAVMLAMAVDFVAGLRKAKQAGIATTSRGFKMTVEKATKYFLPMLCLSCIDIITSVNCATRRTPSTSSSRTRTTSPPSSCRPWN